MNETTTKQQFSWATSDEPIHQDTEDRLDRKLFAHSLADAIREWSSANSLVISLNSPWGLGKTSAKNLVLEALAKDSKKRPIVDFNPWQWTSFGQLSDAFFDEIAIALGKDSRKDSRKAAANWRRYAAKLKGGSQLASALAVPLKLLILPVGFLFGLGFVWPNRIYFIVSGLLIIVALSSGWVSRVLAALSEIASPATKDAERSLDDIREDLAKSLSKIDESVLVVIDDLDRLSPKGLADVIQLVKANGDLPRMIYLLIGDRQIMADHIGTELHVEGQRYLEKIVQVSLDLPVVAIWRVQEVLFAGLDKIMAPQSIMKTFKLLHWQEIFQSGLGNYFDNLRTVNRFLATFDFHVKMLLGESAFEVNAADLIALEAIRLFEPKIYAAIASNKSIFASASSLGKPSKEQIKLAYDPILTLATDQHRADVSSLLLVLFPGLQSALEGQEVRLESKADWSRDLRVASAQHFDKYFQFVLDPRELAQSDIEDFLTGGSRAKYSSILKKLRERHLLDKMINRLREYEKIIDASEIPNMVTALFDIGDFISAEPHAMFSLSPSNNADFLVRKMLERIAVKGSIGDVLMQCVNETNGLNLPASTVLSYQIKANRGEPVADLTQERLVKLKAKVVEKIESAAKNGELISNRQGRLMFSLWKDWGDVENVRAFAVDLCRTPEGAVAFLSSIICTLHSTVPNKEGGSAHHYIRMTDIDDFSDPEIIRESILGSDLDVPFLQANHRVLDLWRKAVHRKLAGKSDDPMFFDEEDD